MGLRSLIRQPGNNLKLKYPHLYHHEFLSKLEKMHQVLITFLRRFFDRLKFILLGFEFLISHSLQSNFRLIKSDEEQSRRKSAVPNVGPKRSGKGYYSDKIFKRHIMVPFLLREI